MARPAPAVDRSIAVLNYLAAHPGERFTLSEIAHALELNKATLHAMLNALTDEGYLVRDDAKKTYGLGPALIALGNSALVSYPAADYARPVMQRLTDELGLDCVASAAIHDEIVILARSGTPRPFGIYVQPGQRLPLRPPLGTVFVAWSGPETIERWLSRVEPTTSKELIARFRSAVRMVGERGFSVGLEGGTQRGARPMRKDRATSSLEEGVRSIDVEEYAVAELDPKTSYRVNHIGAPVFGPAGEVALALFLIGFAGQLLGAQVAHYADRLLASAAEVTESIHGRTPAEAEIRPFGLATRSPDRRSPARSGRYRTAQRPKRGRG